MTSRAWVPLHCAQKDAVTPITLPGKVVTRTTTALNYLEKSEKIGPAPKES